MIVVVFCRGTWYCRASSFVRYLCLSVSSLATTRCKEFSKELLSASALATAWSFREVLSHADWSCIGILYRDVCTFSVYQHFVKSFEVPRMNTRSLRVRGKTAPVSYLDYHSVGYCSCYLRKVVLHGVSSCSSIE